MTCRLTFCRPGFTLIETTIALVLTAILILTGYSSFAMAADARERAQAAVDPVVRAMATRSVLQHVLQNAIVTGRNGPVFQGSNTGTAGNDQILFLATSAPPFIDRPVLVRLYVDGDGNTPEQGLMLELTDTDLSWSNRFELARPAVALFSRYLVSDSISTRWQPTYVSPLELPAGIEIRLQLARHDSVALLLETPLLVRLGNS
jgi:prepilin-type N-terminal cleavage/methylation domain-containing protein